MRSLLLCAVVCGVLLFSGCAKKMAETPTGRPEVVINVPTSDNVRSLIIDKMQLNGYSLDDESKSRLLFTKETGGKDFLMSSFMLGNQYSTHPIYEITFSLTELNRQVKVVAWIKISSQMPFGQTNRKEWLTADNFNRLYRMLQEIKTKAEAGTDSR